MLGDSRSLRMRLHTLYVCPTSDSPYMCTCDREERWDGMDLTIEDCPERVVEAVEVPGGLDAAVERAAFALATYAGDRERAELYRPRASVALKAALSATAEGEKS